MGILLEILVTVLVMNQMQGTITIIATTQKLIDMSIMGQNAKHS